MENYAETARRYWTDHMPARTREIPDPSAFFTDLGREIATEIDRLALEMEGPDRPGESYPERTTRLRSARTTAREIVLADRFPAPPQDRRPVAGVEPDPGRVPLTVAPGDPLWAEIVAEEEQAQETLRRGPSVR